MLTLKEFAMVLGLVLFILLAGAEVGPHMP